MFNAVSRKDCSMPHHTVTLWHRRHHCCPTIRNNYKVQSILYNHIQMIRILFHWNSLGALRADGKISKLHTHRWRRLHWRISEDKLCLQRQRWRLNSYFILFVSRLSFLSLYSEINGHVVDVASDRRDRIDFKAKSVLKINQIWISITNWLSE